MPRIASVETAPYAVLAIERTDISRFMATLLIKTETMALMPTHTTED
jgi:hypothetical protein